MRKIYSLLLALVLFSAANINAQITVVSGGTGLAASYPSLTTATGLFAALNATAQSGAIVVTVTGNTTEDGAVSLNAGTWTSISITASGGIRTISGAVTAGTPMINFNGADNVTIDGVNSGGTSLTISNTTVSSTSGTSTIRFIGGATNNTITNCSILGSSTMAVGTNGGNIFFSTDANTANGNDNNTISNNNIGPAGANLPSKGIYGNGSTTTTAIGNSGITINNNNIFDYFGAATTSAGVYTANGCNTWSITNNRFYQTASRTWTTGAQHSPIWVLNSTTTSGAQGFTITGNIIGYATSTQTGTYTLTGSTGKFIGIFFTGITGGTSSSISSNTIAAVSLTGVTSNGTTTASPFAAILVSSGVATTSSNTIGSQSASGSLVFTTNASSTTDVYGMYNGGFDAWTSSSNNIGGITVTQSGSSAVAFYVMRANMGTSVTWTAASNNVGGTVANSISMSAVSTSSQVVGMQSANSAMAFTSNTVRNLTSNIGTGTTISASVIGICHVNTTPVNTISQCTIHTLTNTNTTAASVVTGIQFTGSTGANIVERNLIYNLNVSTTSASAEVNGIRVGGGSTTYRNNMIALGANIANAIGAVAGNSSTAGINGFNGALGTDNFYHNSIYIGGTATAGSGASYAFNGTQTSNIRAFRNNIFFNARTTSGGTGKHYAVKINGTAPNPTGLTINNNVYFVNGTGGVFGFFNSADVANIAAWRIAVGQDAASFEGNPQYIDPTNATPDLHLHPTNITAAEGNGVSVGVTDDYDGQTRASFTPTDIGADAGNFTGADLTAPTITYTPLSNTCTLTGVTLTATITDAGSGVPTAGLGLPVLYWRVNAGAYAALQGTFVSGSTYSFGPFGNGSIGDAISYYIVAQDAAPTPNVTSNPIIGADGFTANPPNASTPPTTPSSFTLQNSLGGTYTVGSGGNYATITAAVAAYNTSCLTSAVVFNLVDAAYAGETFPITINANSFANATNTLTIKTTQSATTITGTSTTALFVLNGADYVTINGSTGATANTVCPLSAASRDLTITNTNVSTSSAVVWLQTAGSNAATNNAVINCNLVGNSNTTTLFGVGSGSSTISTSSAGTGNNNNSFVNNSISKSQYGIYSGGASAGNKNTGTVINQNLINTASPNNVGLGGILASFENNITISGNTISEINGAADRFAISAGFGTSLAATTTGSSEVTNATITNNIIGNIIGSGANSSLGIALSAATSGTSLIANNFVYGVSHNSTSPDIAAGIAVGGGTGSTTNVFHNTVSMQGTVTGATAATQTSACLAITATSAPTLVDVRNNIFSNTQANNSGTTMRFTAIALGYSSTLGNYSGLTSTNNDLYAAGTLGTYTVGITGGMTGTNRTTLTAWTTETGKDGGGLSKNVAPVFLGTTNLHLNNTNPTNIANFDGTAASGTGITADIDCESRTGPDIGADEFTTPNCTGATGGTASGSVSFCGSGTPTITATGYSSGNTTIYQWYSSTVIGDYPNAGTAVGGQTNPASLTTGVVNTTTYYWLRVTCTAASATDNSTLVTVTVNPVPGAVTVNGAGTFCANATITATGGSGGTINFQGTTSGGTSSVTPSTSEVITASGTYYFRAVAAGCFGAEGSVAVVIHTDPVITGTPASICVGGSGTVAASAGNSCAGFANAGTTLNGTLTAATDPIALRLSSMDNSSTCAFDLSVTRNYTAQQFQVSVTGNYIFNMTASSLSDNMAYIMKGTFTPGVCPGNAADFVRGDDDDGTGNLPRLGQVGVGAGAMTLTSGVTYTLITLNYSASTGTASGTYTWTITPPGGGQLMLPANGTIDWYTVASGGTSIGSGSPFNPVPAGLANTLTAGTTTFYAACSNASTCRTAVNFVINPNYDIVASSGANGTVTPSGTTTLSCDGTGDQTYTITPDACYSVADVLVDGNSVGAVASYTFTNVTANHTISASFVLNTFAITVTQGANGTIAPGTGNVNCGSNATYTITPDACYSIADVIVDGSSVGAVSSYTFNNVTAPHTITASYTLNTYAITVTQGANGTIAPGTGNVNCGSNATYTITPDACYSIADVIVDGSSVGAVSSYTFNNVTAPHTITASYTINTYAITVTQGANGTIAPGTGNVNCGSNATYTITPDGGYSIQDVIVDGSSVGVVTSYTFTNVQAVHTITASFVINCINVGITSVSASNPGPLCSGQTTNLTANGVVGTNAVVTWWTGPNGTGTNLGTGTTLNGVGANTYYARVTGDCGTPDEESITINSIGNTFTGTGNWSDNARWSCGAPPSSGDAVTIASGANATLDVNFTVSGSLLMNATSTLIVNPTRTLSVDVAATANFNGQSVTFKSDNTGTASLGQVNGTLSGATNVTVERYIPNNGFRSWRLLSVPVTTSQTIRQAWQEGDANPLPKQNNVANYGTQITGVFGTQAAATAAGFDSTSVQAGMLRWNGASWSNITSTNQAINNFNSYFLYIRGDRSLTVTGSVNSSNATTLRTKGTVYTGDQTTNVSASAFALIPNLYPSAINFTGLTRTGGVNNLFYIWDSKKLNGQSLGVYQTFSNTNSFNCLISGGSYTLGQPNTTIESGQSFFVTSGLAGTIVLKETAKISGTNGSLGFRPTPSAVRASIGTRLYNSSDEMLDANTVVFDAVYSKAVADEDAPKMGNPGANFAIETGSKLLAIEGTAPVKENDAIQFRMWNMAAGNYKLEFAISNLSLPAGTEAILEDSYTKTNTVLNTSVATNVNFTVDASPASSAANRFRIVIGKAGVYSKAGFSIAPNPIEGNTMNLVFSQQAAGQYNVRIVSANGQAMSTYRLMHAGGNANQVISLPAVMGNGTYTVEIVSPDKARTVKTVLVSRK